MTQACCIPEGSPQTTHAKRVAGAAIKPLPSSEHAWDGTTASVHINGGWFDMGAADALYPEDGEGPVRKVWVDAFNLATTAVSNREFKQFVDVTNYVTDAERVGSSFVFHLFVKATHKSAVSSIAPWWCDLKGACWYAPEGKGSNIDDRMTHPVVHITRYDALRFCQWSGTQLPTEAQWEYAARGGLPSQDYPWGNELLVDGQHCCNIWQGNFPHTNTVEDGYVGTAPIDAFSANAFGLFNMTGNVWEWVADRFTRLHSTRPTRNPKGPLNGDAYVAKGGSYLCHESYCKRYRNASRQALADTVSTGNLGFRVAYI